MTGPKLPVPVGEVFALADPAGRTVEFRRATETGSDLAARPHDYDVPKGWTTIEAGAQERIGIAKSAVPKLAARQAILRAPAETPNPWWSRD